MSGSITVDGVTFDLVVQRDGPDWIVAEADGTVIYSRHRSEAAARTSLRHRIARLKEAPDA